MVRGINRQIVVVKTEGSSAFEAAYFIVRTDIATPVSSRSEMMNEANRIIADNSFSKKRKNAERRARIKNGLPFFLCGGLLGMLFVGALWLISL